CVWLIGPRSRHGPSTPLKLAKHHFVCRQVAERPESPLFPYTTLFRSLAAPTRGDDWPQFRHDATRSAISADSLHFPLKELWTWRSEEHTSELQSRGHLVCRLLLEKKKIHKTHHELGESMADIFREIGT